jgi:hypothetical protein
MPLRAFRLLPGITVLVTVAAACQSSNSGGKSTAVAAQEPGALPPGWTARPDQGGQAREIQFSATDSGYHVTLGPATILYRAEDKAQGPFHTLATFHQIEKPRHPEGYGLLVGGQGLTGKDQQYTYFLVRGDGAYLIKQRKGDATTDVTKGWTPSAAIRKVDAGGKATNLLEIDAKQDPQNVVFRVNGQPVYSTPANRLDLKGIVGLRVNHNLDVLIEGFAVHQ